MISLPKNYFWIPGYEGRYSMKYMPDSEKFILEVFSSVYPGVRIDSQRYGSPKPLATRESGENLVVSLTHALGGKVTQRIDSCASIIRQSKAFKDVIEAMEKKAASKPIVTAAFANKYWIIGTESEDGGELSFASHPRRHASQEEANAESERLANNHPGRNYVVLQTTRRVKTASIVITEL